MKCQMVHSRVDVKVYHNAVINALFIAFRVQLTFVIRYPALPDSD